MSTSNLQATAARLQAAVQRTLSGAKPRHLAHRLHQLLRVAKQSVVVLEPTQRADDHAAVVPVKHRATRLMLAGEAWGQAQRATLLDDAKRTVAFNDKKALIGSHHILAKVLCWLVLAITLGTACGGDEGLVYDQNSKEARCGALPTCPAGFHVSEGPNECELGCMENGK